MTKAICKLSGILSLLPGFGQAAVPLDQSNFQTVVFRWRETTMNHRISSVALLVFTALSPIEGRTAAIDVSDVTLFAFASFKTQTDSSSSIAPLGSPIRAEALVRVEGTHDISFPNVPTSQTKPFASSAADANGFFGVGVNGFFFGGSLPPNALLASGTTTQSIKNNSAFTLPVAVDFFIPAPTIQFFGVGNSFPPARTPQEMPWLVPSSRCKPPSRIPTAVRLRRYPSITVSEFRGSL